MPRWLRSGLAAILFLVWLAPAQVSAYSYGDANTEDVAETFKLIESSLGGASADWSAAAAALQTRRSEIKSHFGEAVAVTLDKNAEAKDAKLLIANFKAVLVMNLDRRFTYAKKDLGDYAGAKLLLAKAKATYDVLAPYLSSGTDEINQAFDDALEALGNPGLFGVGKKEADPDVFKKKVDFVYAKVKPSFPYKAYVKPVVKEEAKPSPSKEPSVASPEVKPDKKPAAATNEAAATATPSASPSVSPSPSPSPSESAEAQPSPSASASAEPSQEASEPEASESLAPSEDAGAATAEAATEDQPSQEASAGHAPMERSNKTNGKVTVFVIGGVVIVGGGILWFIRKKGWI
ncbi:hypothetical protein ACFPVX_21925 [Cohnella faecalis]|uniref:LPXTG cell wall anchor domain-containing protein n=1 Tax=Cohnella faecalis TaxID=2315694 RepID=A0A398CCH6_9BACL|nr:hypothetical protein [Cohnella faecalis]RIE00433.1 hypothetical protein D3H35_28915 [Cohnella faecalis]